jgi:nucleotide-binding universal stress UspA family protein
MAHYAQLILADRGFSSSRAGSMGEMEDAPSSLTIVVGYDGSAAAKRCLARIRQLDTRRMKVLVIAVEPDVRSLGLGSELTTQTVSTERVTEEARALLGVEEGMAIETRTAVGDPADVLIEAARESGAELMIVGRRGGDFVARTLLGSVSQRVVQNAPCDVLVVA